MKARNLKSGDEIEVWEISKTGSRPDWVIEAFNSNYFVWADKKLRIKMAFIHPSGVHNFKSGLVGGTAGYVSGFGDLVLADDGDFINRTRGEIITSKNFAKNYEIL